ncbi:MAG: hypothetical protein OXG08_11825 [Gammaproteobacteria bacterium]|nr:hypothetical protein [Gammaproteobacteria bacterium]
MPKEQYEALVDEVTNVLRELRIIEDTLAHDIDERFGATRSESIAWRQFMQEYECAFPAEHLDRLRGLMQEVDSLLAWLRSDECALAFQHFCVVIGDPGTGKTHGVCDAAKIRLAGELRSCIVFGHSFDSQHDPWRCISEALGLSVSLAADEFLDCLNAAGEDSGSPLLLVIDAINETKPHSYWIARIPGIVHQVSKRPFVRLLVTCRTTYLQSCVPQHANFHVTNHRGFAGIEREACQLYFRHFNLKPPIAPILPPEFSNPLYLSLVCDTLVAEKVERLPPGWSGSGASIIRKFFEIKACKFSVDFGSAHTNGPANCMLKVVKTIVAANHSSLSWTDAVAILKTDFGQPDKVLDWLLGERLLIEDVSHNADWQDERVLRPAFERLGDFLIAEELFSRIPQGALLRDLTEARKIMHPWIRNAATVISNRGVLVEFAVIAPETAIGFELPDLAPDSSIHEELVRTTISALIFRDPSSLTPTTARLIGEAFDIDGFTYDVADALLSCGWRKSAIDATWFHDSLADLPLADRDAFWCFYFHHSYESGGVVSNLIGSAGELPLVDIGIDIAERWLILLLWLTSAADRRVKDNATRAAIAILSAVPAALPSIVERFASINDDEVRERVLLASYGALLRSRDTSVAVRTAGYLYDLYQQTPERFNNAVIRDHMRCICELACRIAPGNATNVIPEVITNTPAMQDWSLDLPRDEEVDAWAKHIRFNPDERSSDFFKYTMSSIGSWTEAISKRDMGKWIAKRVARDFCFVDSECEHYDRHIVQKYGGGRGKEKWAERIAKKYSWIALNQLASNLHDHVERRQEKSKLERRPPSLIFPAGRNFDPTVWVQKEHEENVTCTWALPRSEDLNEALTSNFDEWIADPAIPEWEEVVQSQPLESWKKLPLSALFIWDGREKDIREKGVYRQQWFEIQGYLIEPDLGRQAYDEFRDENLFDRSLPKAPVLRQGFVAEYPWGSAFDGQEGPKQEFPDFASGMRSVDVVPVWNVISCDWEYDCTGTSNYLQVPARTLCGNNLWWNGNGGFTNGSGDLVYVCAGEHHPILPSVLLGDVEYVRNRLQDKGLAIIYAMKGEKLMQPGGVLERFHYRRRSFSQIAFFDGAKWEFGMLHSRLD